MTSAESKETSGNHNTLPEGRTLLLELFAGHAPCESWVQRLAQNGSVLGYNC